jgi:endonuclease/exonuclease/phosphatase family metal-dependent hydrolase
MRHTILIASLFLILASSPGDAFSQNRRERDQARDEIVLLTYNVRNCSGLDNITDYQRVADIISTIKPDVVALQELDSATLRSGKIIVLNELALRTKLYPVFGASINYQGG